MSRGRKKGSTSFINLTQEQIRDIFGPSSLVKVSRVQVEELGFLVVEREAKQIFDRSPIEIQDNEEQQSQNSQKIELKLHTFED